MLTVLEAAKRVGRNPETVRRWIREGRLKAQKLGGQHFIEEADLEPEDDHRTDVDDGDVEAMPIPEWMKERVSEDEVKAILRSLREVRRGR